MIRLGRNYPFILILCTLLALVPMVLQGQETFHYSGPLQIGKYKGEAGYDYKIVSGDTLLHGPFLMERSNLEALLENEDASFLFSGTFTDHYPTGFWRFQLGEFQSNSQSQVIDYQYRVLISGLQEEASGILDRGKPDGPWTYLVNQIKDSEIEKTLFKSTITFEKGIPQQSFRIENEKSTLVGRLLRNGLAHDEWSLYGSDGVEALESWIFNEGVLEKIQCMEDNETKMVELDLNLDQRKTITLDDRYVKILELQLFENNDLDILERGMPKLLSKNAQYYHKIDAILSKLGESEFLSEFKVKVAHYPLDSVEEAALDSIATYFNQAKTTSDALLNSTQLNILKLSDTEALFLYEVVSVISEDYLNPIAKVVEYDKQGILEFMARDQLFPKLWPKGMPATKIEVFNAADSTGIERTFELSNAEKFRFDGSSLSSVRQLAQYTALSLDQIQGQLRNKLTQEQREQELIALEEELIAQSKGLYQLLDSIRTNTNGADRRALKQIQELTDNSLSKYSTMEEAAHKFESAQKLVACFGQLHVLAREVAALPAQWEEMQTIYQDGVWNPFTATVMNEEVKKRITSAYRKVLVPYLLKRAQNDLSCETAEELTDLMQGTYKRMTELREEDTSKLERKLRKEQDPKVVLQLFNVQPPVKE